MNYRIAIRKDGKELRSKVCAAETARKILVELNVDPAALVSFDAGTLSMHVAPRRDCDIVMEQAPGVAITDEGLDNEKEPDEPRDESIVCGLCGKSHGAGDAGWRTAWIDNDGRAAGGFYQPRLTIDERHKLKGAREVYLCDRRQACQSRQIKNNLEKK